LLIAMPAAIFLVGGEFAPRLHHVDLFFTSQPSRVMAASVDVLR
jgi:hypothetical protein